MRNSHSTGNYIQFSYQLILLEHYTNILYISVIPNKLVLIQYNVSAVSTTPVSKSYCELRL